MFSTPVFALVFCKKIACSYRYKYFPTLIQTSCSSKNMSTQNWQQEKARILNLSPEEKRKTFKSEKDYVNLDSIDSWDHYVTVNKNIENKKHTLDDLAQFKKIKLDHEFNKKLIKKVSIYQGDITKLEVDAIVNAANSLLRAGGGVDGAIHRAAGPLLQQECYSLNGCPTGEAKITGAYQLPAKYVIHTVGPQDGSVEKLTACYENSLSYHKSHGVNTIAFPCISTGIYGFPNRLAAHIALRTARKFMETNDEMKRIIFCTFMPIDVDIYETLMQMYFPLHEWNYNSSATVTE